jgi:hypothetical protein
MEKNTQNIFKFYQVLDGDEIVGTYESWSDALHKRLDYGLEGSITYFDGKVKIYNCTEEVEDGE